jgi:hypothetical protein
MRGVLMSSVKVRRVPAMPQARNFIHLQFHEYRPDNWESPDVGRQFLRAVTAKGLSYASLPSLDHPPEVTLSRHGLLQIALQRIDPFRQCSDAEVEDRRVTAVEAKRCRNRPLLLEALADALLAYEDTLRTLEADAQGMPDRMNEALSILDLGADVYFDSRARRTLPTPPLKPPLRREKVTEARQTYEKIKQALTPEVWLKVAGITSTHYQTQLCLRMRDAFHTYGPTLREFPNDSIVYAIALILWHFKVEPGTNIDAIADRIQKRIERNQDAPAS